MSPAGQMWPLLLALLPTWAAPSQGSVFPVGSCKANWNYSETFQKCCYQCQAGYNQDKKCPLSSSDCTALPCPPGHFLNRGNLPPRCEPCVECSPERYLVEREPCTPYANRVCECQAGRYCKTSVPNACVQCALVSRCPAGSVLKIKGSTTSCEKCPPGTFSDQESNTQTCRPHRNCTELNRIPARKGNATHDEQCVEKPLSQPSAPLPEDGSRGFPKTSPTGVPGPTARGGQKEFNATSDPDLLLVRNIPRRDGTTFVLLGTAVLTVLVLLTSLVIVRRKMACKQWRLPPKTQASHQARSCAPRVNSVWRVPLAKKRIKVLESALCDPEEGNSLRPKSPGEAPDGKFILEAEKNSDRESDAIEVIETEEALPVEHPSQNHTSNRIDKIYIMRADTVIVGSASKLPLGRSCPAGFGEQASESEREAEKEESAMRYPEQETECCAGSRIVTPVEEEWEFQNSNEKPALL